MKPFPEDDPRLSVFLKQHRPDIPPASPDLEAQIMAAIATTPQQLATVEPPLLPRSRWTRSKRWVVPSAIAAGLLVSLMSYRSLTPAPTLSEAELAELETFIETTWHDPVVEQPVSYADELLTPSEPTVN